MEFAITFKGDIDPKRTVRLCKMAEEAGFVQAWFFDSHILWRDCYATMAMCIEHTHKLRFGPCVTNPGVRDWSVAASMHGTLAIQSEGRIDMGVGRGDSSRRVMGRKPMTVETMVEFAHAVKGMIRGDEVSYEEDVKPVQIPWATGYELPVWFAAYGPKALAATGQHADGLIIQLADPWLVKWFSDQALAAASAAGRDMSHFKIMSAAPVWVGDINKAREQTRWFPAMVGNHVADLVDKYGREGHFVPKRLTDYVEGRKGYDYRHHADKDADHLGFITEDIIDSFGVLGDVDAHLAKMRELESVGVTQFNIYLMCGDEERMIEEYGTHILPKFAQAARA
jgi:probable F420-dependent oxidoreductase